MIRSCAGGWCLLFLAAIFPGVHLQGNGRSTQAASHSELPSEAQIYQLPVLWPIETTPFVGTYTVENHAGITCIKATMGVEYIVIEKKKSWYFNLDPSRVITNGLCGEDTAVLFLTLPGYAASLQFTFKKGATLDFYVTDLAAHLSPRPVCLGCANKTYSGSITHDKLFAAGDGQSFKCSSVSLLSTSSELRIKLVRLQVQAFRVPTFLYGQEVDCWTDFYKELIPIIIGATVLTLVLTALLTFLLIKDRHRTGYVRI
ncbi:lysosome-associated membrane glycoprotein 3 [Scomber scombrus]|uniref:Lysosome-associated membrane glycoprotein 3 n=1 Tax=Scomber scombrus TaxID=13677 RepID=A0AAV1PNB8_SCOSC